MKKQTIAVDIDDVLAESTEALRIEVNKRLGVDLQPDHYKVSRDYYWGYYESVWEQHGIAGRITMDQLDPQMKADQSHVLPHAGSLQVLRKLAKKYRLITVTGRSSNWRQATENWLELHYPGVFEKVLFGEGKQGLEKKSKGEICVQEGVSWLIDDGIEHALSAAKHGVGVVLFGEYGWHSKVPAGVIRCKDWQAVEEYFNGIS